VLEDRWQLERVVVPLKKHAGNPVMTRAFEWEGAGPSPCVVLYDPAARRYRMWYVVWSKHRYDHRLPFSYNVASAESADGLNWERPPLGVFDALAEDSRNNFIRLGKIKTQGIDVQLNPEPGLVPGRYVALYNDSGGLFVATSDDGKDFKRLTDKPALPYHSDTANNFVHDEVRGRWLLYCRARAFAGDHKRRVAVAESADLRNWSHERTILIPDETARPEYYGLVVFRRGDLFFGMLSIYDRETGSMHPELVWSSDGLHWEQVPGHPAALERGPSGAWDYGMVATAESPVLIGNEWRFYYAGWSGAHNVERTAAVGFAIADRDRLIGLRAGSTKSGFALTRPFLRPGARDLTLNAVVQDGGFVRAEIRDDFGKPIEGFTAADCDPIEQSGLELRVRWKGRTIAEVPAGEIRLRLEVFSATVYAYDFITGR
jgi:hypothetical protein